MSTQQTPDSGDYNPALDEALSLSGHGHEETKDWVRDEAAFSGESVEQAAEDEVEMGREFGIVSDELADKVFASVGTTRQEVIDRITRIQGIPTDHPDYDADSASMADLLAALLAFDFDEDDDDLDDDEFPLG